MHDSDDTANPRKRAKVELAVASESGPFETCIMDRDSSRRSPARNVTACPSGRHYRVEGG